MAFTYKIYDHDVGNTIYTETYPSIDRLVNDLQQDLASLDSSDSEFAEDPTKFRKEYDEFKRAIPSIIGSVKSFKFAPFCGWRVDLPGNHRSFIVKQA